MNADGICLRSLTEHMADLLKIMWLWILFGF
jgi:hypothetical protein